ncbi:MAG TPA: glycerophosphodiester phosphodiesterase family protein [Planctomycetota bacterium]
MRILALLLLAGCGHADGRTRVLAHRGSPRPEGTIAGGERSIALGVEILEMDVRLTRDGHAVILHDAAVDRTTNGKGPVAGMTLAELQSLDAGEGQRIPTVAEFLAAIRGRAWVTLELKVVAAAERVVEAIRDAGAFAWAFVRSSDLERLGALKKAEPRLKTGAMAPWPTSVARLAELGVAAYTPGSNAKLTREDVASLQAAGILVWATLCNDAAEMRRLAALGVDGIITDDPSLLIGVLRN